MLDFSKAVRHFILKHGITFEGDTVGAATSTQGGLRRLAEGKASGPFPRLPLFLQVYFSPESDT